jgi:hypothetical protein
MISAWGENFAAGLDSGNNHAGGPASRYGLSLKGGGWLVRDAGTRAGAETLLLRGVPLKIAWLRDVEWIPRIRVVES